MSTPFDHAGVPDVTPMAEMVMALNAQRAAFRREGPPSAEVRRQRIDRLILLLTDNADEFAECLNQDFGSRPRAVSLLADVAGALPDITLTRRRLNAWMRPRRVLSSLALSGMPTVIERRPLGVVGIIGPWNFPIGLVVQPAASAFAAGNRVMIKLSEVTPRTSGAFAARAAEYFDPAELAVFTGGADVGSAFSALPFDHLFFTGSPAVGALVARAAADNLVPVTLELGGKNPAVVSSRADARKMGERVMAARLVNGGQICLSPDYVFVPRARVGTFVDAAMGLARRAVAAKDGAGLVSIVDHRNYDRVITLIDDARQRGASVRQAPGANDRSRRRVLPTILLGVTDEMTVAREEVFGPVLAVYPYDCIDEVVAQVTNGPAPLAAYWYGPKDHDYNRFRREVSSGGMTVNDFAVHCAMNGAPFGGVGRSGYGAYHGKAGFDTFSHLRTITTSYLPVSLAAALAPPYSSTLAAGVGAYVRFERRRAARRLAKSAAARTS
jgi:coniferyl-aldehyde dehydrogenase